MDLKPNQCNGSGAGVGHSSCWAGVAPSLARINSTLGTHMQEKLGTPASALWSAAHVGDLGAVEHLIAEGVDVNVWDLWGRSALFFAASAGHLNVASVLVNAGAWVDPHDDYDIYDSPLVGASSNGHAAVVTYLLGAGATQLVALACPNERLKATLALCILILQRYYARPKMQNAPNQSTDPTLVSHVSCWARDAPSLERISREGAARFPFLRTRPSLLCECVAERNKPDDHSFLSSRRSSCD